MTMSPSPSTEKGYCLDGSEKLGNKNLTGASMRVATVIWQQGNAARRRIFGVWKRGQRCAVISVLNGWNKWLLNRPLGIR